jgi:hypothetical protein
VTDTPVLLCKQHLNDLKASVGLIRPEDLPEYADRLVAARMAQSRGPDFDQDDWLERFAQRQAATEAERAAKVSIDRKAIERQLDPYSVVYFIRMGDLIKIGYTTNLQKRVSGLSLTMAHVVATVFGGSALEEELHERFADLREHGEWFRAEPPLLDYIETTKGKRRVSRFDAPR